MTTASVGFDSLNEATAQSLPGMVMATGMSLQKVPGV